MLSMNKKAKRFLIGGGGAAAVLAAGSILSAAMTKNLVDAAMDRDCPSSLGHDRSRLSGSSVQATSLEQATLAADALEHSETETVEIISHDGEHLVGHWYPCENPGRVILAMHGWRSSWAKDFGVIAPFWHNNGCAVLFAEQRGQCASGGEHMGFGLIERHDCLDWLNWINHRTGRALPVYLAGVSMGATTVLMASGLELPENVVGIMADCGYTSVHEIWKHVLEQNLHLSYRMHGPMADRMCKRKIQMGTKDYSTTEALEGNKVPVLFAHGTDDHFVPVEMTYENYKACRAPKRLFIVPGAGHGMSYFVDRTGYERETLAFWADCEKQKS